jgi:hypothetical protein
MVDGSLVWNARFPRVSLAETGSQGNSMLHKIAFRLGLVFCLSGLPCGVATAGKPGARLLSTSSISVTASPLRDFHKSGDRDRRVGKLDWRGGLVLTSPAASFGGYSGLHVAPDGQHFLAVSDAGTWLKGRLTYSGDRPTGIADAVIGPLLARNGRALVRSRDRDAEAVRLMSGSLVSGRALVAFEHNQRIGLFRLERGQLMEPLSYLRPPLRLPGNKGLESVAVVKAGRFKGAVVAFAEHFKDRNGHHRGWMWWHGRPHPIAWSDIGGFDITDLVSLDDGRLVVLERRFRWSEGVRMRLRMIEAGQLVPGAVLNGITLLRADMRYEIDNMEGLAAHRDAAGRTVLTLISDNNFNPLLQRTLLLQFSLSKEWDLPSGANGRPRRRKAVN